MLSTTIVLGDSGLWRIGWCGHDKSLDYMATKGSALPPESEGGCGEVGDESEHCSFSKKENNAFHIPRG